MIELAAGLYALYALLAALNGNAVELFDKFEADVPGFLPWLVAAGALGALYNWAPTHGFARLFIWLAVLAFVASRYSDMQAQWAQAFGGSAPSGAGQPQSQFQPAGMTPLGLPSPMAPAPGYM